MSVQNLAPKPAWGERGNFAMMFAFTIPLLFALGALVVDVGFLYWTHNRAQLTAEAAALGAVRDFNFTPSGIEAGKQAASAIIAANDPNGEFSFSPSSEFVPGMWGVNPQNGAMEFTASSNAAAVNAVKITVRRTKTKGNALSLFFAQFFSSDKLEVATSAIALVETSGNPSVCNVSSGNQMNLSGSVKVTGRVCSNANITVSGSVDIKGDLSCGPPPSTMNISGSARITGSRECLKESMPIAAVNIAPFRTSNDNARAICSKPGCINSSKDLTLNGNETLTLSAGNYYFNNVNMSGNTKIIVQGKVNIYIDQNLNVSGNGFFNSSFDPNNLNIFIDGGGANLSGNTAFFGNVYGPETSISMSGSADFNGSVHGKFLNLSGSFQFNGKGGVPPSGAQNVRVSLVD